MTRILTYAAVAALCVVATACSGDKDVSGSSPAPETARSVVAPQPSGTREEAAARRTQSPAGASRLHGVWASSDGNLRLVLRKDGTFTEDYNGTPAAYEGRYTLREGALTLKARTGEGAEGQVSRDRITLSGQALLPAD